MIFNIIRLLLLLMCLPSLVTNRLYVLLSLSLLALLSSCKDYYAYKVYNFITGRAKVMTYLPTSICQ